MRKSSEHLLVDDTCDSVEEAIVEAKTARGRTFGAWMRGIESVEAAKLILDSAGMTLAANRKKDGVKASIGQTAHRGIKIMFLAVDEPEVWAAGRGGYLHPSDRPEI